MATRDTITTLIESLSEIQSTPRTAADCSESGNRKIADEVKQLVWASDLDEATRRKIYLAIGEASNPSGHYYSNNGIKEGLDALRAVLSELEAKGKTEAIEATQAANSGLGLNLHNLRNLVSDGSIFYVDFTKRTTGERRLMRCHTGVKKHLKGGAKAYSAKAKNLLTVFDMNAKGYRSIPVEAIQALTVNGQAFNFAGV